MSASMDELKATVRTLAQKHGFELCHFTRPAITPEQGEVLDAWIAAGMHGDMAYMGEEVRTARRKAPETMLEGVRTVISLGMRHTPPSYSLEEADKAVGQGVIAAYAHGDDYHVVMKKRLKALAAALDELLGEHGQRVYVDTAPVLEHAMASASGLGWQGKHSLTINRQLGSWLMLGEIFTTADLVPDESASFHCGTCQACLDICPTDAIVAPFVVDARRCISYLTIEYTGIIPRELRPKMGNRIFGCDDCQSICPWNRQATPPSPDLLKPRGENILPALVSLLRLDEAGFRERFRKSPVKRTGRAGLLRNVCIAIGNSGDASLLPQLLMLLNDEIATLRAHVVWAIQQLCDATSYADIEAILEKKRQQEADPDVMEEIELSLREIRMKYG